MQESLCMQEKLAFRKVDLTKCCSILSDEGLLTNPRFYFKIGPLSPDQVEMTTGHWSVY